MLPDGLLLANFTQDYRNINLGVTGVSITDRPTQVFSMVIANTDSKAVYVKLYDKATAATEADTPVHTYPIPAGWIQPIDWSDPDYYTKGLSIRASGAVADNDTTGPTASTCIVNIHYK